MCVCVGGGGGGGGFVAVGLLLFCFGFCFGFFGGGEGGGGGRLFTVCVCVCVVAWPKGIGVKNLCIQTGQNNPLILLQACLLSHVYPARSLLYDSSPPPPPFHLSSSIAVGLGTGRVQNDDDRRPTGPAQTIHNRILKKRGTGCHHQD